MAELRAVYLITGDDDPKIDAWRVRLKVRAEAAGGPGALETIDAGAGPEAVAGALATLTLAASDRYLLVDGVEAWKAADLDPLESELAAMPEATVLLMIARGKAPARLAKAVAGAGGEQREYAAPKPWEMPKWAAERAGEAGIHLDRDAARALVSVVGTRQQRLAREIEKLGTWVHPRAQLSAEEVYELASGDVSDQAFDLADAIVAGDERLGFEVAERLTSGEPPSKLSYAIVRRLRDVHRIVELLDAGVPEGKVQGVVRMPPWAWKRTVAQARKADRERLARALCAFADLEIELRGGGVGFDERTAFSLTLARASG
ncbi:MAG: hypothetical protein NVS2B6_02610 [Thermoleophilaceae bacterium]